MTDSARQDARTAWLLREGDQLITAGGDRYTILDGAPGLGGSGVVYPARKNDDVLLYAVKECFPSGDGLFCWERRNGVIRPAAAFPGMEKDLQMLLPQLRASYEQEKTVSQEISNRTNRVVEVRDRLAVREVITNGQTYSVERGDFAPEEPLYLLMQYQTGRNGSAGRGMFLPELLDEIAKKPCSGFPLRTGGRPSPLTAVRILREILLALQAVHAAGYLYGDIQPGNLLFLGQDLEHGEIGHCCLPDLGCARKLEPDGQTAPVGDGPLFTTSGYTPPEMLNIGQAQPQDLRSLRLTPAADIYSAGRLLHLLLTGRSYKGSLEQHFYRFPMARQLSPAEVRCTPDCFRRLEKLTERMVATDRAGRAQTAEEVLYGDGGLDALCSLLAPPPWQVTLAVPMWDSKKVFGREEDLEAVGRMLQAPDAYKPLFLTGFYGMGKSTLAVRFAQEWKQNYPDAQVFWVRFPQQGGLPVLLGETMAQAISTVQTRDSAGCRLPQKTLCDDVLEQLGQNLRRDDLIVIDNADSETLTLTELLYGTEDERDAAQWREDLYPRLCSLPAHILMTTRMAVQKEKSFYHYPVKPLSLSALRAMMRSYYPAPCSDKVLDDLITLVESHTMTVGMIARTMQDSGIAPEEMLEKLRQPGGYDDEAFVRIPGEQPGEGERRRKIEGHLLRLFQIQNLPQKEQAILRDALLIGDSGMPRSLFWKLSPEIRKGSDKDAYQHLVALGYISESLQAPADEPLLHIHALVRVVGRKKVPPTEEKIEAFLSGVRNNRSMKADSDDSLWPSFYSMEVKLLSVAESYQMAWSFSPQNTYLSFKRAVDALDWYDHSHLAKRNREFSEKALVRGVTLQDLKEKTQPPFYARSYIAVFMDAWRFYCQNRSLSIKPDETGLALEVYSKFFDWMHFKRLTDLAQLAAGAEPISVLVNACLQRDTAHPIVSITESDEADWLRQKAELGKLVVGLYEQEGLPPTSEIVSIHDTLCDILEGINDPCLKEYQLKAALAEERLTGPSINVISLEYKDWLFHHDQSLEHRFAMLDMPGKSLFYAREATKIIRHTYPSKVFWSSDSYYCIRWDGTCTILLDSDREEEALQHVLRDISTIEAIPSERFAREQLEACRSCSMTTYETYRITDIGSSDSAEWRVTLVPYRRACAIYLNRGQPVMAEHYKNKALALYKKYGDPALSGKPVLSEDTTLDAFLCKT